MKEKSINTSIAPWFSISDGDKAVTFYKNAFGAIETYRLEIPGGGLVVKLAVDSAEFWVNGESPEGNTTGIQPLGGNSVRIILTVANPEKLFEQALKAGAIQIFPVGEEHGWRLGRLEDPFGLHWEIGHPLQ